VSSRRESHSLQTGEILLTFEFDPVSHISDRRESELAVAIYEDLRVSLELLEVLFLSTLLGLMMTSLHLHALELKVDLLLTIHLFV
jgi:hypothetical protein